MPSGNKRPPKQPSQPGAGLGRYPGFQPRSQAPGAAERRGLGLGHLLAALVAPAFLTLVYLAVPRVGLLLWGALFLAGILCQPAVPLRVLDWAVVLVLAYEVPSLLLSGYLGNGVWQAETVGAAALFYFLARLVVRTAGQFLLIAALVGAGGVLLSGSAISQFGERVQALEAAGLAGIVAFRSQLILPPSGWVLGEWFTLLLLTLPFALAVLVYFWLRGRRAFAAGTLLVPLTIVAALFLSCSRSVFWSVVVLLPCFVVMAGAVRLIPIKHALLTGACGLAALALLLAVETAVYPGLAEAYVGRDTSQVRSVRGRLTVWKRSMDVFRASPLLGVGSGNAPLFLASSPGDGETTGFASRTFSLPVQILAEKGAIGAAIYLSVLLLAAWSAYRKLTSQRTSLPMKGMFCCLSAGLVAVLFRELTYSSLLEHAATAMLVAMILALLVNEEPPAAPVPAAKPPQDREAHDDKRAAVKASAPCVTVGRAAMVLGIAVAAVSFVLGDYDAGEAKLQSFYIRMQKADFRGAQQDIDEAVRLWPSNARHHSWRGYCLSQNLPSQCPAPGVGLDTRATDDARQAATEYRKAVELNGQDPVAHHNLAWLDHLLGNNAEAHREWERAIALDPENAIFHLSFGLFLEETGEREAARRQYVAAIELSPAVLDSPFFSRLAARTPDDANWVVQQAISHIESRVGNDPILKARLGKLWLYRGNLQRAFELLESAAHDLPNLPMVWFNLGEVRRLQGNGDDAAACYNKARFLDAGLAGPPLRLGQMYGDAGQRDNAIQQLRLAVRNWGRINPPTAAHNSRLYAGIVQPIDDLLPTTLVWYVSPCEASAAYAGLAALSPGTPPYVGRSKTCESLPAPHGGPPPTGR